MNVHILQHVSFEGPGEIEPWMRARGHHLTHTHFFRGEHLPDSHAVDWLIVMGGPMNIYEYRNHPWLRDEKRFIERVISRDKCVLGVCLGAQLIADVLGARVYQNYEKEIGWFPIQWHSGAAHLVPHGSSRLEVFHWHGDTFDIPEGGALLADSEGCRHQGFSYGSNVVGLQFHLEMNASGIEALIEHGRADLTARGRFVQTEEEIKRHQPRDTTAVLGHLLGTLERGALIET
jgi:GMP synthase (glutamine-hydrolysing)